MSLASIVKTAQAVAKTSKAFGKAAAAGKAIWILGEIADMGMDTYMLGDQIARALMGEDYDAEMKQLSERVAELGVEYDQLMTQIAQATEVDIPNLSSATIWLQGISQDFEVTNGIIFEKCDLLDDLRHSLREAVPTSYTWFTNPPSSGIDRDVDKEKLESIRKQMGPDYATLALHSVGITLRLAYWGYSLYKQKKGPANVTTHPRRNAMANIFEGMDADEIKRIQLNKVSKFKQARARLKTYGKIAATSFSKLLSVGSFGMNIYMLIEQRKQVNAAKQSLREMITKYEQENRLNHFVLNGCKKADGKPDLEAIDTVAKQFELTADDRAALEIGYRSVLAEYDVIIDKLVNEIDETYAEMIQTFEDVSIGINADNQVVQMLRSAHSQSLPLHSTAKDEKNDSDDRKNAIDKISKLFSDSVAKQINDINQSLTREIEDYKALNLLKPYAEEILEDAKRFNFTITEEYLQHKAKSVKNMLENNPDRTRFKMLDEILQGLKVLIAEITEQSNRLPNQGVSWSECGEAYGVTAMTSHQGELYVISNNRLWKRGDLGPGTGNDWSECGEAYGVTAMTSHQGELYVISNNRLWKRGDLGPGTGNDWSECGEAFSGVTAMTSHRRELYVISNNKLWKRGDLGPGTGNDWSECGEAFSGVTAMTSHRRELYVISNNKLWKRGDLGPGTGNDWSECGEAFSVTAMASHRKEQYVASNNKLWKRGKLSPSTGNDSDDRGILKVSALTSH